MSDNWDEFESAVIAQHETLRRLRAENAELRKDAARYRWLREQDWNIKVKTPLLVVFSKTEDSESTVNTDVLDAAIDAAMEGKS